MSIKLLDTIYKLTDNADKVDGKHASDFATSKHTHNYAGSDTPGGSATSANKLNTDKGSATNPVYFSGGIPVACTYSLNATVPSNAKFTDTNTWRGITDSYSGTDSTISLSQKGGKALYDVLVNGYASSAGNADTLDNYHASSFVTVTNRQSIYTSDVAPYAYVYLFRIANTSGYSTTRCDFDIKLRNNRIKFFIDIVTKKYPYGSSGEYGTSISIYKETKTENSLSIYYVPTVASSGYNYYDVYCKMGTWQSGQFDLVSSGGSGSLFYEIKKTYLNSLPSGAIEVEDCYYNKASVASKLETARTISLTGAVTGSGSFNGSENLSIATTVNHTHNYAGSDTPGGSAYNLYAHSGNPGSHNNVNTTWYTMSSSVSGSAGYAGNNYGFPVSNNANGLLWLGCHRGPYGGQLGISSNGRIYYRFISNNTFPNTANGGSWNRVAWTSEIPTVPSNVGIFPNTCHSDFNNNQGQLITRSFMSYWTGAYNSNGSSNLTYCKHGAFGTIVTKNVGDFAPASHPHNYAGSSSAGGPATSADKLNTNANAGDRRSPVYFSGGVPVACDYLNIKGYYSIDASSLSTSNFYPVTFASSDVMTDCEIHSPSLTGTAAYNQNVIHFQLIARGWTDTPKLFKILHHGVYSATEITIGAIGSGNEGGMQCVWVRGGMIYRFYCNKTPVLRTSNISNGSEIFTVGTGYSGGTNTKVTVHWKYGETGPIVCTNSHTHSYAPASHTHTKSQITDFSHTHNYAGSSSAGGDANNSVKWGGYKIVVGSTGTATDTIYFVT
jgi:hypothetical protein